EDRRVAAGWAPFWHYTRLGRYGEQLDHLFGLFPREQVFVLRYRDLVDSPGPALTRSAPSSAWRRGPSRRCRART
ncbi:MAG TPA: hypothetical protein VH642_08740, partial [Streptosporangiaceae bacterium]